jgi:hypothetical protein
MTDWTGLIYLVPLAFFSVLAFWKESAILFIITAALSLMVGLKWFDIYVNETGLSIGLMLIVYSFVSFGFSFRIMWERKHTGKGQGNE